MYEKTVEYHMNHTQLLKTAIKDFFFELKDYWNNEKFSIVIDQLANITTQGKLIRGSLFLEVVLGSQKNLRTSRHLNDYLNIALAIEIIHTGYLIHDDIMDKSTLRRGFPTVHKLWEDKKIDPLQKEHYGASQAICIGDIAFFQAQELFIKGVMAFSDPSLAVFCQREWVQVCFGQMMDMYFSLSSDDIDSQTIMDIYLKKTAQYTFSLPLCLGGKIYGLSPEKYELLYRIGQHLGILFQIQDDFLDIFGNELLAKKTLGQDIKEGKKTLLLNTLYQTLNKQDKMYYDTLKTNHIDSEKLTWIHQKIKEYHILEKIDKSILIYQTQFKEDLESIKEYQWIYDCLLNIFESSQTRVS